jgi:hypothetical protein
MIKRVLLGGEMKLREIGQCKDCYYYKRNDAYPEDANFEFYCSKAYIEPTFPETNFGCWYWREKKK